MEGNDVEFPLSVLVSVALQPIQPRPSGFSPAPQLTSSRFLFSSMIQL